MILSLDVPCDDHVQPLMSLCLQHKLYAAYLHVCARTAKTAVSGLLSLLTSQIEDVSAGLCNMSAPSQCAQVLLKWLEYLWTGTSFPMGVEGPINVSQALELLLYLFSTSDVGL